MTITAKKQSESLYAHGLECEGNGSLLCLQAATTIIGLTSFPSVLPVAKMLIAHRANRSHYYGSSQVFSLRPKLSVSVEVGAGGRA